MDFRLLPRSWAKNVSRIVKWARTWGTCSEFWNSAQDLQGASMTRILSYNARSTTSVTRLLKLITRCRISRARLLNWALTARLLGHEFWIRMLVARRLWHVFWIWSLVTRFLRHFFWIGHSLDDFCGTCFKSGCSLHNICDKPSEFGRLVQLSAVLAGDFYDTYSESQRSFHDVCDTSFTSANLNVRCISVQNLRGTSMARILRPGARPTTFVTRLLNISTRCKISGARLLIWALTARLLGTYCESADAHCTTSVIHILSLDARCNSVQDLRATCVTHILSSNTRSTTSVTRLLNLITRRRISGASFLNLALTTWLLSHVFWIGRSLHEFWGTSFESANMYSLHDCCDTSSEFGRSVPHPYFFSLPSQNALS